MPDYKTMYFQLFRKMADAVDLLQNAMEEGEESYIQNGLPEPAGCIADTPAEPGEQGVVP